MYPVSTSTSTSPLADIIVRPYLQFQNSLACLNFDLWRFYSYTVTVTVTVVVAVKLLPHSDALPPASECGSSSNSSIYSAPPTVSPMAHSTISERCMLS